MAVHGRERTLTPAGPDTGVAHPSRVYDYWLGGKDHYPPDAEAAQAVAEVQPGVTVAARANRAFLGRAVRHLVAEAGIRQILDVGTGLPSTNNVHEVAQAIDPQTRVVYVDNDPIVLVHAQALLTGPPGTIDYVDADLRDPQRIIECAAKTLDLDQPVALTLLMVLQFVPDEADPHDLVAALLEPLAPGSHLVLSHPAGAGDPAAAAGEAAYNRSVSVPMTLRAPVELARFVEGLEVLDPGLVPPGRWRPDHDLGESPAAPGDAVLCAVARKR